MRTNCEPRESPPASGASDAQRESVVDPIMNLIPFGETRRLHRDVLPASGMKGELQSLLALANDTPQAELPQFLGDLERIRVTAFVRLTKRTDENDELLPVEAAAARLKVSVDYMYRHHAKFSFTRREGRKLLFSSAGLNAYMRKRFA
jgi:hypothetical protein